MLDLLGIVLGWHAIAAHTGVVIWALPSIVALAGELQEFLQLAHAFAHVLVHVFDFGIGELTAISLPIVREVVGRGDGFRPRSAKTGFMSVLALGVMIDTYAGNLEKDFGIPADEGFRAAMSPCWTRSKRSLSSATLQICQSRLVACKVACITH